MLWRYPLVLGLVFALSAAQLLPFLDLVAHAQRETGYTDLRWSMPGSGLANFLVPMAFGSTAMEGIFFQHGQYWTSSYYLGLGTVVAGDPGRAWFAGPLADREGQTTDPGLVRTSLSRRQTLGGNPVWLLALLALIALLCALGENTPLGNSAPQCRFRGNSFASTPPSPPNWPR